MITSALILIAVSTINFLLGLLPAYEKLPTTFTDAWDYFAGFTQNLIWVFPDGQTLLTILRIWPIIITGLFIWFIINWLTRNR